MIAHAGGRGGAPEHRGDPPLRAADGDVLDLDDAGMHVSRKAVAPLAVEMLSDLPAALRAADVELRIVESLTPLRNAWATTLHVSGIRMRNATGWRT
jgi:hypothetical protein